MKIIPYINGQIINDPNNLNELSIEYSVIKTTNQFEAHSQEEMQALCRFFVYEDCLSHEVLEQMTDVERANISEKIRILSQGLLQDDGYIPYGRPLPAW